MSEVTWLCLLAGALAFVAITLGYASIGVLALVLSPLLAWYDWRAFGPPPTEQHWWNRFGPSPPGDTEGGGSRVPAGLRPRPNAPSGSQALPSPDED
jgi:hypothetical protein